MALKIISFIFVLSLAFGIQNPTQVKDVPFNVNDVINRVTTRHSQPPDPQPLTPDLTGEFMIDTNVVYVPAPGWQDYPSVAFDGTNYLVVWQDGRFSDDIYGARVNQAGQVLDPAGIAISTADYGQYSPSVAFDGTNYLAIWVDNRSGSPDIYGARVSQAVQILDPTGIVISTGANSQGSPSVAFDGTSYLIVWEDERSVYTDIYGARVNPTGQVLDPEGIAISTAAYGQSSPSIAFDGINYLVVWEDSHGSDDIYGARVNQAGQVLDPEGIAISTADYGQYSPSVAFDDTNYLVVWEDYHNSGSYTDIYGTRVSQAGQILDPAGIAISTANNDQWYPSLAFDGTNYLVVWEDNRNGETADIYGARVNQAGQVLDPTGIAISTNPYDQAYPSVAFDGTNYLIVWEDWCSDYPDIYGAMVNQAGVVIDSFAVTVKSGDQLSPNLAKGSGNQVLITYSGWTDEYIGRTYDAMRIWGKFYPFIGIGEEISKVKMQSAKLLEVYPNPAKTYFAIRLPQTADRSLLKIFDVSGKLIKEIATPSARNDGEVLVSLKGINPGIYFLRFGTETRKFLVIR